MGNGITLNPLHLPLYLRPQAQAPVQECNPPTSTALGPVIPAELNPPETQSLCITTPSQIPRTHNHNHNTLQTQSCYVLFIYLFIYNARFVDVSEFSDV